MRTRHLLAAAVAGASLMAVVAWALPAAAGGTRPGNVPPAHGPQAFAHMDHVFVIMMENTAYNDLLDPNNANTPFIRSIASTYGLETNYSGVTHVSMPNYIAATSGSNWNSNSDDVNQAPYFDHENIVDQFEQAHVSWKAYMEDLPSAGDTLAQTSDGLYVRKHDPFLMYRDVYTSPARASNVVPLTQLTTDLNSNHVPQFVWITPNQCNNMHGGTSACPFPDSPTDQFQQALYQDGNNFLQTWVTAIMHSKAWTDHSAIFVTWDESSFADDAPFGPNDISGCCDSPELPATPPNPTTGGGGDLAATSTTAAATLYGGGHVPMIVIQRGGAHHRTEDTATNHYSLLQTIEQNWNLPYLGNASDTVQVHSLAPLLKH
jgi:phosphatidylinositol-3-phosphatase